MLVVCKTWFYLLIKINFRFFVLSSCADGPIPPFFQIFGVWRTPPNPSGYAFSSYKVQQRQGVTRPVKAEVSSVFICAQNDWHLEAEKVSPSSRSSSQLSPKLKAGVAGASANGQARQESCIGVSEIDISKVTPRQLVYEWFELYPPEVYENSTEWLMSFSVYQ